MKNRIAHAYTCMKHEYCTNCPSRKRCSIRASFYNQSTYQSNQESTNAVSYAIAVSIGYSSSNALQTLDECSKELDKKRKEELRLHPTYSEE